MCYIDYPYLVPQPTPSERWWNPTPYMPAYPMFPDEKVAAEGWICPVCGKGVAPTEKRCPCK